MAAATGELIGTRTSLAAGSRRVMWHGMFLFLLGMLMAFVEPRVANVRMGLAAHLVGLLNGIFLIALGAVWSVAVSRRGLRE